MPDDRHLLTNAERRDFYIQKAREAERRAARISDRWLGKAEREILWRRGPGYIDRIGKREFDAQVNDLRNKWRSDDPTWKAAVSDNQWFTRYATMYGAAATDDTLRELLTILHRLATRG